MNFADNEINNLEQFSPHAHWMSFNTCLNITLPVAPGDVFSNSLIFFVLGQESSLSSSTRVLDVHYTFEPFDNGSLAIICCPLARSWFNILECLSLFRSRILKQFTGFYYWVVLGGTLRSILKCIISPSRVSTIGWYDQNISSLSTFVSSALSSYPYSLRLLLNYLPNRYFFSL